MPNWKKLLVSGSDANLSNLNVDNSVSAVSLTGSLDYSNIVNAPNQIDSASFASFALNALTADTASHALGGSGSFSGSFYGDGSNLTGITIQQAVTVIDSFINTTLVTTTHNFGTKNVIVSVYNNDDQQIIPTSITTTTENQVTITFNVPETGRVVIAKGGHIVSPTSANSILFNGLDTGSFATTGSNLFKDDQTISGSIIPAVNNLYDLGSPTKQWRDLYLSSASLYIDGTKVLSSTADTLTFTTDVGQSIKILESGADDITLQTDAGNIELKGTVEILSGKRILDSAGTVIQFGDSLGVTGSIVASGTFNGINLTNFSSSVAQALSDADINSGSFAGRITTNEGAISDLQSDSGSFESRITPLETFSSSLETTILTLSGSFSGSFVGDGSQLSGVTSYTDDDTLAYINSLNVLSGSAGYATDAELNASSSALIVAYGLADTNLSSSIAIDLTAVSGGLAGRVAQNEGDIDALQADSGSFSTRVTTNEGDISNLQSDSGSFSTRITPLEVLSSSLDTALTFDNTNVSVAGNLEVLGTASFGYITSVTGSAKIIGDNYIILNADTPTERYSGIRVYDSGSAGETGSLEYDSIANHWFYESANEGYAAVLMSGPKATRGALSVPTSGSLVVASGNHLYSSNISDLDGLVKIQNNTQITGSLGVSGGITGALTGNASTATSASHAGAAPYSGLYGTVPTWNQNTTGNAATATSASYAATGPFLTSYTETDTLATVTGRGASTTTALTIDANEGLKVTYNTNGGDTWLRGWGIESNRSSVYLRPLNNNTQTLYIGYNEGPQDWASVRIGSTAFTWNGNTVATQSWVTSQSYLTSYTETDTLATVTARGASTTVRTTFTEVGASRAGSDTVASGPWFRWTNADESRQMLSQLNASNGLTTWAYNGTAWASAQTIQQDGTVISRPGSNAGAFTLSDTGAGMYRDNTYDMVVHQSNSSGSPLYLSGAGNVVVSIDNNNNETDRKFIVGSNAVKSTNELFSVNEGGNGYFAGQLSVAGFLTNNGGAKLEIQAQTDGTSARGIYMWDSTDANWGIYMGQAGAGKSLADGTAASGIDGRTGHAIRFRVNNSTSQIGFLWENSSETALMQLQPNTGNLYVAGNISANNFSGTHSGTSSGTNTGDQTNVSGYSTYLLSPNGSTVVAADSALPSAGSSFIHTLGLGPSDNDGHILGMTWTGTAAYGAQIWVDTDPNNRMAFRSRSSAGAWTGWNEVIHSSNYNSYAPTLTGGNASGTWSINITGNAGTATSATTATNSNNLGGYSAASHYNFYKLTSFSVGGNTSTWYPVRFSGDYWGSGPVELELLRTSVHQDGSSYGYMHTKIFGHSTAWGHHTDFWEWETNISNGTYGGFFNGVFGNPCTNDFVVFLRGGLSYYHKSDAGTTCNIVENSASAITLSPCGNSVAVKTSLDSNVENNSKYFQTNLNPKSNNGANLGSTTNRWNAIYAQNGYFYGDVTAYYSSDERLKTNIVSITDAVSKVKQIGGYNFEWITDSTIHTNTGNDIGVIAQEIENVLPEAVTTRDNGYKAVRYEKIVPLLIEAIKEQQSTIESLEKRIESLENR